MLLVPWCLLETCVWRVCMIDSFLMEPRPEENSAAEVGDSPLLSQKETFWRKHKKTLVIGGVCCAVSTSLILLTFFLAGLFMADFTARTLSASCQRLSFGRAERDGRNHLLIETEIEANLINSNQLGAHLSPAQVEIMYKDKVLGNTITPRVALGASSINPRVLKFNFNVTDLDGFRRFQQDVFASDFVGLQLAGDMKVGHSLFPSYIVPWRLHVPIRGFEGWKELSGAHTFEMVEEPSEKTRGALGEGWKKNKLWFSVSAHLPTSSVLELTTLGRIEGKMYFEGGEVGYAWSKENVVVKGSGTDLSLDFALINTGKNGDQVQTFLSRFLNGKEVGSVEFQVGFTSSEVWRSTFGGMRVPLLVRAISDKKFRFFQQGNQETDASWSVVSAVPTSEKVSYCSKMVKNFDFHSVGTSSNSSLIRASGRTQSLQLWTRNEMGLALALSDYRFDLDLYSNFSSYSGDEELSYLRSEKYLSFGGEGGWMPLQKNVILGMYQLEGCHHLQWANPDGTVGPLLRLLREKFFIGLAGPTYGLSWPLEATQDGEKALKLSSAALSASMTYPTFGKIHGNATFHHPMTQFASRVHLEFPDFPVLFRIKCDV